MKPFHDVTVRSVAYDRAPMCCDGCMFYDHNAECPSADALKEAKLPHCTEEDKRFPRGFIYVKKVQNRN